MPVRMRLQVEADERDEIVRRTIDAYDEAWLDGVKRRWRENCGAGRVLRPPAFTFPDGRVLNVHGRGF